MVNSNGGHYIRAKHDKTKISSNYSKMQADNGEAYMTKTVAISDDVHILVVEKQTEIFKKHRINVKIADIVDTAILHGIDNVEDKLITEKHKFGFIREKDLKGAKDCI